MKRSTPLRRVSAKQRARQRVLKALEPIVFARDGGRCKVRLSPRCTGRAETMHHVVKRSGHAATTVDVEDNLLSSCWWCNAAVEDDPLAALAAGVSRPRHSL